MNRHLLWNSFLVCVKKHKISSFSLLLLIINSTNKKTIKSILYIIFSKKKQFPFNSFPDFFLDSVNNNEIRHVAALSNRVKIDFQILIDAFVGIEVEMKKKSRKRFYFVSFFAVEWRVLSFIAVDYQHLNRQRWWNISVDLVVVVVCSYFFPFLFAHTTL